MGKPKTDVGGGGGKRWMGRHALRTCQLVSEPGLMSASHTASWHPQEAKKKERWRGFNNMMRREAEQEGIASRGWGGGCLMIWFLKQVLWSPTFCLPTGLCLMVSVTVFCLREGPTEVALT